MQLRSPHSKETLVYLWNFRSCKTETLKTLNTFLSASEKAQRDSFRLQPSRDRYTFCRAMLRWHLGYILEIKPTSLSICANENGKPLLNNADASPKFNYSHSGDYVAFAFNMNHAVGIDIEHTSRQRNVTGIANSYFTREEAADLLAAGHQNRQKRFYAYWTLKEAYLKARGEGIFAGLSNFSFALNEDSNHRIRLINVNVGNASDSDWHFVSTSPLPNYQIALAIPCAQPVEMTLQIACESDLNLIR